MYTVDVSGILLCNTPHQYHQDYNKEDEAFEKATSFTRRKHFYKSLTIIIHESRNEKKDVYRFEMADNRISEEWSKRSTSSGEFSLLSPHFS